MIIAFYIPDELADAYRKETKELLKLCKRACDRIAKDVK